MAGHVNWHGNQLIKGMQAQARRNTNTAALRLKALIIAQISQSGELRYNPIGKRGKALKKVVHIYNFTHSVPGNPPFEQTGHLRRSITREILFTGGATFTGRVGTNLKYGLFLELGTRKHGAGRRKTLMKARPFLRPTLQKYLPEIRSILIGGIAPGGLSAITAVSNRSGVLGSGAIGAGFG